MVAGKLSAYCHECHAAYTRAWRATHSLDPIQRFKMNSRSYANVYQRRGKIVPQPCEVCGSLDTQKHHDDYGKPLAVRWFCEQHHRQWHRHNVAI
jgi:hypothetical protein